MKEYINYLNTINTCGKIRKDRTGVGTISIPPTYTQVYKLNEGFPLLGLRKLHFKSIVYELLWFIKGRTDHAYLKDNGVSIWDEWIGEDGTIGPGYGKQWRDWVGLNALGEMVSIDQLTQVKDKIINEPWRRDILLSSWNVSQLKDMELPPCHLFQQWYVDTETSELDLMFYMRSSDAYLGAPFNIASYALLLMIMGNMTDLRPRTLTMVTGDSHIYLNHVVQVEELLTREELICNKPTISFTKKFTSFDDIEYSDIVLSNYNPLSSLSAPVAV